MYKVFTTPGSGKEKDILPGILLTALHNLVVMLPTVLLLFLSWNMIQSGFTGNHRQYSLVLYWGIALALLIGIYYSYRLAYRSVYVAAYRKSAAIRIDLAEKIRQLPLSYFGQKNLSELSSTMMDDTAIVENALTSTSSEMFGGILSSLIFLFALFFLDWRMALSLFACLPVSIGFLVLNLYLSPSANRKKRKANLNISEGVQEFLDNIKIINSSPHKESYLKGLEKIIKRTVRTSMIYELVSGVFISAAYNVLRVGLGLVVVTGIWLMSKGEISLFIFLFFIFVAAKIYDPLTVVFFLFAEYTYTLLSADRIQEIHDHPVQQGKTGVKLDSFDISFERVSFAYQTENVIDDVSFVARQGEITALAGPSGSGKTTLSKLACRFWDVNKGKIFIGGEDISTIDPETLMGYFSMVFQDVVLFNDTIYNNIRIGKKDATTEEILAASRLAGCEDFIVRLPDGYNTFIGENGKTLSGGERQRISIARAFLKDAPIILLDEATSSLDPENETLIQEAVSRLIANKTVLIIAHRLPLIEHCDHIVVLEKGKVAQMGTHEELMKARGLYHRLFNLQKQSLQWKAVA